MSLMSPGSGVHTLGDLLLALSTHMDGLAEQVNAVEHTIGDRLAHPDAAAGVITQLQSLDYLRQSLEDVSVLMLFLSRNNRLAAPVENIADMSSKMKLNSTKTLIAGNPTHKFALPDDNAGDLDLF